MEGHCGTSLFLFSNKWLTGQGLVYLLLFEGLFVALKRAICLITLKAISMGSHDNLCCRIGCLHARDKSDENTVGILTGNYFF